MSCLVQGNVSGVMDFQEVWNEKECIEERRAPKGIEGRKMAQGSQQGQPMLNDVEFLSEGSRPLEERSVKASGTASTEWGGQQASEQNLGVVQNLNMQEFIGNETITGEQWQRVSSMACGLTEYEKEDIFPLGDECSPVGMLSPFFYRDNNEKAVELIGSSTSVDFNYFNNNDKLISCGKKVIDFFKKCNLSEEDKKNIAISLARKIVFQDIAYDEINAENIVNVAAMIFAEDKEFTVTDGMPDVKVDDRIFSFYTAEKDQIKLIYDIFSTSSPYGGLREGGYKLALALGRKSSEAKEIIDKLLSGSYHISALSAKIFPETFSDMLEILQKNKADDIGMLKDEITRYNQEEYDDKIFEEFADIFGLDVLKYKSNIKYIIQYINELNNEKMNDDYESGLSNMVVVLPTANKNLSQLTFIPSIIMDLKRTAEKCCSNHEIWKDVPLFVFDQTKDAESLNKNKNFIHSLQQETNARIAFIDMKQIKELGEIFNIESLFDTTGKENAGYGGGRNIASFLGALIGHAVKSGFFDLNAQNIVEIIGKEKDRYKRELDDILTGKNKIKLIMGDDDTTVLPGFFAAKAFQAFQYKERSLYSSVKGFGRASIVVPMSLDSKAYLGKEYFSKPEDSLILALSIIQSGWINDTNMIEFPLAGALVSPLFCLDLPLPSEEKNFTNFQENINDILARAVHHCGDRIGNWEERLYNFTLYREQLNMASWLTLSEKDSRLLFWNSLGKESADASEMTLKKVFTLAAADSARTERARTFLELIQRAPSRFSQDYPRQEIHDAIKKSMLEELASEQGQKQENGEILTPLKMLFCSHADMVAWNVIKGVGDDYRVFMELRKQLADRLLRPEKDGKNTFESKVEKKDWNSFEKIIQEARKATEEFMVREHIDKSHIRLADTFEAAARSCLYRFGNIAQTLADMGGTDTSSST